MADAANKKLSKMYAPKIYGEHHKFKNPVTTEKNVGMIREIPMSKKATMSPDLAVRKRAIKLNRSAV